MRTAVSNKKKTANFADYSWNWVGNGYNTVY